MPKYEVIHSALQSNQPHDGDVKNVQVFSFKQGEVVSSEQLAGAGFDVDFLLKNGAIEALKGTDDTPNPKPLPGFASPPTTTAAATPNMATVPLVSPDAGSPQQQQVTGSRSSRNAPAAPRPVGDPTPGAKKADADKK